MASWLIVVFLSMLFLVLFVQTRIGLPQPVFAGMATVAATLMLAFLGFSQLEVAQRLKEIQGAQVDRDTAIIEMRQIYVDRLDVGVQIVNRGLRDTMVQRCFLETRDPDGRPEEIPLIFMDIGPRPPEGNQDPVFIGRTLKSGHMLTIQITPERRMDREVTSIFAFPDPVIQLVPVLGEPYRMPIKNEGEILGNILKMFEERERAAVSQRSAESVP